MTAVDVRRMLGLISALLLVSGVVLLALDDVPASLGWPFTLLFWSAGLGMGLGVLMSLGRDARES